MNFSAILIVLALIALLLFLLWLIWKKQQIAKHCRHDLALRNLAGASAYQVRVAAYTPTTQILNASAPSSWLQTASYPHSVLWRPAGGPIPVGNPLPGPFSVWIQNDAQTDKRVVVEWLGKDKAVLCRQTVRVGCGLNADAEPESGTRIPDPDRSEGCRCLSVESDGDEDSNEFAEPDLTVEVGVAVQTGFLQVTVPYTIEAEPPQLAYTRLWEVTAIDELGVEQPLTVPFSDNLAGQATFTLPEAGDYNFYLTVTDPATCISATDADDEETSDFDFTSYKLAASGTQIGVEDHVDPCDPRRYRFTNESDPGLAPSWEVKDMSAPGQPVIPTPPGGNVLDFTFPSLNVTYQVCLTTQDANGFTSTACVLVTPSLTGSAPDFDIADYNSCVFDNFNIQFINLSTAAGCPVDWDWDFGDGTAHSTNAAPLHVYAVGGTYTVTLTMTMNGLPGGPQALSTSKTIDVSHWAPGFHFIVCPDGHVIFETSVPQVWVGLKRKRIWSFDADADYPRHHRHRSKIRVCYPTPGIKIARLSAVNGKKSCETALEVNVPSVSRCCPHDQVRSDETFTYKNRQYRLRTVFRYRGGIMAVIFGKSKLQVKSKSGPFWFRKRAYSVGVEYTGNVLTEAATGCYCMVPKGVSETATRSNRARVSRRHFPQVGQFRVGQGGLTSVHSVRVDSDDSDRLFTHALWAKDCGCG